MLLSFAQVPSWRHKRGPGEANGLQTRVEGPHELETRGAPQSQLRWLLRTRQLGNLHHSAMSAKCEVVVTVKHMQTEGKLHLRVGKTSTIAEVSTSVSGLGRLKCPLGVEMTAGRRKLRLLLLEISRLPLLLLPP